jgi:hypothetical protein
MSNQTYKTQLFREVKQALKVIALLRPTYEVTADDAVTYMAERHPGETLGVAMGVIFRDKKFYEFTGRFVPSKNPKNHGRAIRVWRLRYAPKPTTEVQA